MKFWRTKFFTEHLWVINSAERTEILCKTQKKCSFLFSKFRKNRKVYPPWTKDVNWTYKDEVQKTSSVQGSGLRADAGTPGNYYHYMKIEAYIVGIMIRPITKIMLTHFVPLASFWWTSREYRKSRVAWNGRSSHRKCSVKKGVLKNFVHFTGKHLH